MINHFNTTCMFSWRLPVLLAPFFTRPSPLLLSSLEPSAHPFPQLLSCSFLQLQGHRRQEGTQASLCSSSMGPISTMGLNHLNASVQPLASLRGAHIHPSLHISRHTLKGRLIAISQASATDTLLILCLTETRWLQGSSATHTHTQCYPQPILLFASLSGEGMSVLN